MAMTDFTWATLAAVNATHPWLSAFDYDFSDVPSSSRQAVLIRELSRYHNPANASHERLRALGFGIDEDGIKITDLDAVDRAYTFAVVIENESCEFSPLGNGIPGPIAHSLGYKSAKEAQNDAYILAEISELVAAALGLIDENGMSDPSAEALQAMTLRLAPPKLCLAAA